MTPENAAWETSSNCFDGDRDNKSIIQKKIKSLNVCDLLKLRTSHGSSVAAYPTPPRQANLTTSKPHWMLLSYSPRKDMVSYGIFYFGHISVILSRILDFIKSKIGYSNHTI